MGAWSPDASHLRFRQAPQVSVPVIEVVNTLVPWLYWMSGSYAGRLGAKMPFMRLVCLDILVLQYLSMSSTLPT
jgi:hypothetical protein